MMKRSLVALLVAGSLSATSFAGTSSSSDKWKDNAKDAWIDGKAETVLMFNGNLNAFDINTDVKDGRIMLTGEVANSVDKKLAEELVADIDGVSDVDNQLTVKADENELSQAVNSGMREMNDAKITTVIKTRLLMDSDISGLDIDVDVISGNVTLTGQVETGAMKDLAEEIAQNVTDVNEVNNELMVISDTAMYR